MISFLIWPLLLFFFILSFSYLPLWVYPLMMVMFSFAYYMDKKLKDKYTYHKPEDQALDDFDPVY